MLGKQRKSSDGSARVNRKSFRTQRSRCRLQLPQSRPMASCGWLKHNMQKRLTLFFLILAQRPSCACGKISDGVNYSIV